MSPGYWSSPQSWLVHRRFGTALGRLSSLSDGSSTNTQATTTVRHQHVEQRGGW
jgi:hypothetical protein